MFIDANIFTYLLTGHLKVLSLDYSISRIAFTCAKEYRLLPRDALHTACCKAYWISEMARVTFGVSVLNFMEDITAKSATVVDN